MARTTDIDRIRLRVLIVDPHEVSRAAVRALLQTEGVEVVADVSSGEEALAVSSEVAVDVAVVDVSRGVEDALALANALASSPSMPAVILTASAASPEHLDGHAFISKADLCARALRALP